ncbi:MAG TPA: thioredoxin family protein [Gammaproteobacteria bacterium]|nr:thioredoxin family protein [Gammaproteobacteria bacterium]
MLARATRLVAAIGVLLCAAAVSAADIGYDAKADPFAQLSAAVKQADAQHKLLLLVAGGDWCIWCHYLYEFLDANHDLDNALHDVFVVQKVYVGEDNPNTEFFATLPKADGAPHFWIVSGKGQILESQPTVVLEDGKKSYDKAAFAAFVDRWRKRGAN